MLQSDFKYNLLKKLSSFRMASHWKRWVFWQMTFVRYESIGAKLYQNCNYKLKLTFPLNRCSISMVRIPANQNCSNRIWNSTEYPKCILFIDTEHNTQIWHKINRYSSQIRQHFETSYYIMANYAHKSIIYIAKTLHIWNDIE